MMTCKNVGKEMWRKRCGRRKWVCFFNDVALIKLVATNGRYHLQAGEEGMAERRIQSKQREKSDKNVEHREQKGAHEDRHEDKKSDGYRNTFYLHH